MIRVSTGTPDMLQMSRQDELAGRLSGDRVPAEAYVAARPLWAGTRFSALVGSGGLAARA